jgi:hypothetical protein
LRIWRKKSKLLDFLTKKRVSNLADPFLVGQHLCCRGGFEIAHRLWDIFCNEKFSITFSQVDKINSFSFGCDEPKVLIGRLADIISKTFGEQVAKPASMVGFLLSES